MTGNQIREIRERLGWSTRKLADTLDVDKGKVELWEACGDSTAGGSISGVLDGAMNWVEFEATRMTDAELAEVHRRVDEALAGTGL